MNQTATLCTLTVQTDERVFGGGGRRQIPIRGDDRRTGKASGLGRRDTVARLARQPGRADRPLAHYRMPTGQVGQRQTVNRHTGGRQTVDRLFPVPFVVVG